MHFTVEFSHLAQNINIPRIDLVRYLFVRWRKTVCLESSESIFYSILAQDDVLFLQRHRKYGGAPHVWQWGAEEEVAGASAQRRHPLLLLYDRYIAMTKSSCVTEIVWACASCHRSLCFSKDWKKKMSHMNTWGNNYCKCLSEEMICAVTRYCYGSVLKILVVVSLQKVPVKLWI